MGAGYHDRPETLRLLGWTQPLQSLLYWRLPFSPKKNDHSRCHFLLWLISRSSPELLLRGGLVRGFPHPTLPFSGMVLRASS